MNSDLTTPLLQPPVRTRKKKQHILFLFSSKAVIEDEFKIIEKASNSVENVGLIKVEDPDEALRIMSVKNIDLIILDHSFLQDEDLAVQFALEAKQRRKCPIFFITARERKLIDSYRKTLFLYEELDDYLNSPLEYEDIHRRIRRAFGVESRAAKRFTVRTDIQIFRLGNQEWLGGTLEDLSLVGIGLRSQTPLALDRLEQIRISLPLHKFGIFHPQYGEFLKLSARVRRLSIDGHKIGGSWEHLTAVQLQCLQEILTSLAKKQRVGNTSSLLA